MYDKCFKCDLEMTKLSGIQSWNLNLIVSDTKANIVPNHSMGPNGAVGILWGSFRTEALAMY